MGLHYISLPLQHQHRWSTWTSEKGIISIFKWKLQRTVERHLPS
jgi:hypothetical protein